jgi:hypothetical protein
VSLFFLIKNNYDNIITKADHLLLLLQSIDLKSDSYYIECLLKESLNTIENINKEIDLSSHASNKMLLERMSNL